MARFAEDSFIVVDNVFTRDEVEILRQACSPPEDQPWAQSERLIHSLELPVRHEAFLQLARDPRIVSRLSSRRSAGSASTTVWRCVAGVLRVPKLRCYLGHAWHQEGDFATEVNRRNGLQWIKEEGS